jgi:SH3-like domain-containing protein
LCFFVSYELCGKKLSSPRHHNQIFMTLKFKIFLFVLLVIFIGKNIQAQDQSFKSLAYEIQTIQKQMVPDKRTAILEISLSDTIKRIITVKGETNLPEGKDQILKFLASKEIQFVDSIRLLPGGSLGDKTWGLAALSVSNLRAKPDHESELVSQALMGTPLKVLESVEGWYRVQTPDKYIGWMDSGGLTRFNDSEMARWKKSNRYIYNRIFGKILDSPDKKGKVISDLVLCDLMEVESVVKGYLKMKFPDGRSGFVKKKDCLSWQDWAGTKPDVQSILKIANQMMGFPYLWGGTSSKTADCSGFTKTAYYSQGIVLSRDASQQARYGQHIDFNNPANLQPGDLLFFGRSAQRVTHTGIYIGNSQYIHASSAFGRVHVNSIDPKSPEYVLTEKKQLVVASRILDSLNTEGIVLVKDHPWYSLP